MLDHASMMNNNNIPVQKMIGYNDVHEMHFVIHSKHFIITGHTDHFAVYCSFKFAVSRVSLIFQGRFPDSVNT